MYFTVDRIEENMIVLENDDGECRTVPATELPPVRQGDVLRFSDGQYCVDTAETARRRQTVYDLEQKLKAKFQH